MIIGSTMDNLDGTYVICTYMLESVQNSKFKFQVWLIRHLNLFLYKVYFKTKHLKNLVQAFLDFSGFDFHNF